MTTNKTALHKCLALMAVLLPVSLLCAVAISCHVQYRELSVSNPAISQNLKDYYGAKSIAFAQGKFFEAKLLQCVKVKAHECTYYHYWVVVAPKTEMPLYSLNIFFLPPPKLSSYFLDDHPKASNEMMKGSVPDLNAYPPMKGVAKLWPIEYQFTWSNYGDDAQKAACISTESFDEQMRTLSIQVQYNGTLEALSLSSNLPIDTVVGMDDSEVLNNGFLRAILEEGTAFAQRNPYRAIEH